MPIFRHELELLAHDFAVDVTRLCSGFSNLAEVQICTVAQLWVLALPLRHSGANGSLAGGELARGRALDPAKKWNDHTPEEQAAILERHHKVLTKNVLKASMALKPFSETE
jgi:hypothetical protein